MTSTGTRGDQTGPAAQRGRAVPHRGRRWRGLAIAAVVLAAVVFAVVGLTRAAETPNAVTREQQIDQIAASLRCPTCQGLSVADSPSQLAEGMRGIIADQVARGRSPDQIRAWFVDRYGPWILLAPPATGVSALVWVLPVGAFVAGVVIAWRRLRRGASPASAHSQTSRSRLARGTAVATFAVVVAVALAANVGTRDRDDVMTGRDSPPTAATDPGPPPIDTLRAATAEHPNDPATWLALATALDQRGDLAAALGPYRRALRLAGDDPAVQRAAASALIRAGRPAAAEPVLIDLRRRYPDDAEILLLLGTAQRALGRSDATATLRRFLRLAPDHPAADAVRALLDGERAP